MRVWESPVCHKSGGFDYREHAGKCLLLFKIPSVGSVHLFLFRVADTVEILRMGIVLMRAQCFGCKSELPKKDGDDFLHTMTH